jgi:hypothetical protein
MIKGKPYERLLLYVLIVCSSLSMFWFGKWWALTDYTVSYSVAADIAVGKATVICKETRAAEDKIGCLTLHEFNRQENKSMGAVDNYSFAFDSDYKYAKSVSSSVISVTLDRKGNVISIFDPYSDKK